MPSSRSSSSSNAGEIVTVQLGVPEDYPPQIKRLRGVLGLTQVGLAQLLGVSFATVNRWENGQARPSRLAWERLKSAEQQGLAAFAPAPSAPPARDRSVELPFLDFGGRPEALASLVEFERLSNGHAANPAFAAEGATIDLLPHQRIAVYERMLGQQRLRLLLADDAGAGKTVMTGLYVQEMLGRKRLRRILIVPPAGLVGNWQRELRRFFGLDFRIVAGSDARSSNPFKGPGSDQVIVSVDTLAGERMFSRLQDGAVEPYDLVVFDEAHKLSAQRFPDGTEVKTDRYRLAEALAGTQVLPDRWQLSWGSPNVLLLTATPHMGKAYPYYALWRLLEPQILSTPEAFESFPEAERRSYFIRRTKEEMRNLEGKPLESC